MLWHVFFDGDAAWFAHVCQPHRATADALGCATDHGGGECDHVAYAACECPPGVFCDACVEDLAA